MKPTGVLATAIVVTPTLSWLLYMGGLAALQDACNGLARMPAMGLPEGLQLPWPGQGCSAFGFWWFVMAYELLILLALAVVMLCGRLDTWRLSFLAFFTAALVLFFNASDFFVGLAVGLGGGVNSRLNATAAGAIVTAIANFFVVAVLGKEEF